MSKFLNQGAYGCVFKPGVKCDGRPLDAKHLSKIQKKKPRTDNEPIIGKLIRDNVSNYEQYYAPALEVCKANISMIKPDEVKKCKVFDNKEKIEEEFVSIKMMYVGDKTLGDNLDNHYKKSPETFLAHLKDTERYLNHAIKELVKIQVVHNDLKLNNVMYSKEQKVPIIIDFGMAYEIKSLYRGDQMNTVFFTHYEKYPPWCLEKLYIGYIVNKGKEGQNWQNTNVDVKDLKNITNTFFKENELCIIGKDKQYPMAKYQTKWNQYVEAFQGKRGGTVVKELLKHWDTWDMYSVHAMSFMTLAIFQNDQVAKGKMELDKKDSDEYMLSLSKQLYCAPEQRNKLTQ